MSDPTPVTAGGLVEALARAHGLLDLADTDDTAALRHRLITAAGPDIVLTAAEEIAYQHYAVRPDILTYSDTRPGSVDLSHT